MLCLEFDGTERWQVDTAPPAQIYYEDSKLAVSTTDGTFEIIDISSGERTNVYDVGGTIDDFAVGDGRIYYQHDTRFKTIDIQDESKKWSIDTGGKIFDISFAEGALYTGWDSGRFEMRNPTDGAVIWEHSRASKNVGYAYEYIINGRLITIHSDTIQCFFGQKGLAADQYRRLTTPEGIGSRLNQLISDRKLTKAEKAIENGRYQTALRALEQARWRLRAIDGVLGLTALGGTYVGSRKSVSSIRRHRFERKVNQLQAKYPISEGALDGLAPRELLSQAEVALESRDTGLLGERLRIAFDTDPRYDQLGATISRHIELAPRLTQLSRDLDNFRALRRCPATLD